MREVRGSLQPGDCEPSAREDYLADHREMLMAMHAAMNKEKIGRRRDPKPVGESPKPVAENPKQSRWPFRSSGTSQDASQAHSPHPSLPDSFICPLTKSLMNNPVIDREGNSYEKDAILEYLQQVGSSPVTENPLHASDLVENRGLQMAIQAALVRESERSAKRKKARRFQIASSFSSSANSLSSSMKEAIHRSSANSLSSSMRGAIHRMSRTPKGRKSEGEECDVDDEERDMPGESSSHFEEAKEASRYIPLQDCSVKRMRSGVMLTDDENMDALSELLEASFASLSDSEEVEEGSQCLEHPILQDSMRVLCPYRGNESLTGSEGGGEWNQHCEPEECDMTPGTEVCPAPNANSLPPQQSKEGLHNMMAVNSNRKEPATSRESHPQQLTETAEERFEERLRRKLSGSSCDSARCKQRKKKPKSVKQPLETVAPGTNDAMRAEETFEERLRRKLLDNSCHPAGPNQKNVKQLLAVRDPSADDMVKGRHERRVAQNRSCDSTSEKLSELANYVPNRKNTSSLKQGRPNSCEQSNFEKLLLRKISADDGSDMKSQKQSRTRAAQGEYADAIIGPAISELNTSEGSGYELRRGRAGKCKDRRTLLYEGLDSILEHRHCDLLDDTDTCSSASELRACNDLSQFEAISRNELDGLKLQCERAVNCRDRRALLYEGLDSILARRRCAAVNGEEPG